MQSEGAGQQVRERTWVSQVYDVRRTSEVDVRPGLFSCFFVVVPADSHRVLEPNRSAINAVCSISPRHSSRVRLDATIVTSNDSAHEKCIRVKVLNSSKICSAVKVEVGEKNNTDTAF